MDTNEDVVIHIKQGDVYKKSENLDSAVSEYQKALRIEPDNPEALLKLGQVYELKGDREKEVAFHLLAQNAYEKAIAKEQDNAETHNSIISVGVKLGRIDELVKQYKEKLKKNPGNSIISDSVRKLATISLISIPPKTSVGKEKGGCSKIFLDYIFPFLGIIPLLLGTMLPKLKGLQTFGIFVVVTYLLYKLLSAKKPSKGKQWQ